MTRTNWILLVTASITGLIVAPPHFAWGIICGGLIVTVNFHLLYRTLKKALKPPNVSSPNVILAKYYIRFIVSGLIIFVLISQGYVNPLGLLAGLSIVVASIMLATLMELKKLPSSKPEGKKPAENSFGRLTYYGGLGFLVALSIFVGLALGTYLDRYVFDTSPWLTLIFLGLGIVAGFSSIGWAIRKIRKF